MNLSELSDYELAGYCEDLILLSSFPSAREKTDFYSLREKCFVECRKRGFDDGFWSKIRYIRKDKLEKAG